MLIGMCLANPRYFDQVQPSWFTDESLRHQFVGLYQAFKEKRHASSFRSWLEDYNVGKVVLTQGSNAEALTAVAQSASHQLRIADRLKEAVGLFQFASRAGDLAMVERELAAIRSKVDADEHRMNTVPLKGVGSEAAN